MHHQQDELNVRFFDTQYMIGHNGDPSHWSHVQAKFDILSPADGSIRYWMLGDDPRFQYGKRLAEIDQLDRHSSGMRTMHLPSREYSLHTMIGTIPPFMERPACA